MLLNVDWTECKARRTMKTSACCFSPFGALLLEHSRRRSSRDSSRSHPRRVAKKFGFFCWYDTDHFLVYQTAQKLMLDDDSFDVRFANLISAKLKPVLSVAKSLCFFITLPIKCLWIPIGEVNMHELFVIRACPPTRINLGERPSRKVKSGAWYNGTSGEI